jgi:predicted  nucleic acid-binding Zn-ribbon protein
MAGCNLVQSKNKTIVENTKNRGLEALGQEVLSLQAELNQTNRNHAEKMVVLEDYIKSLSENNEKLNATVTAILSANKGLPTNITSEPVSNFDAKFTELEAKINRISDRFDNITEQVVSNQNHTETVLEEHIKSIISNSNKLKTIKEPVLSTTSDINSTLIQRSKDAKNQYEFSNETNQNELKSTIQDQRTAELTTMINEISDRVDNITEQVILNRNEMRTEGNNKNINDKNSYQCKSYAVFR